MSFFDLMPVSLIVAYSVFANFACYQSLHVHRLEDSRTAFGFVLTLSAFAAMVCGAVFLIYYGWAVRWYLPIILFLISFALQGVWFAIEARLRLRHCWFVLSVAGFVVWPLAAIAMFRAIPTAR